MRFVVEVAGVEHDIEASRIPANATLGQLYTSATGQPLDEATALWVDDQSFPTATQLASLPLPRGARISRSPTTRPSQIQEWTLTLAGGVNAGQSRGLPTTGPLQVGRSGEMDLVIPSLSVSRAHLSLHREGSGVRVRDAGSANGTIVDDTEVGDEGYLVTGDQAIILAGGVPLRLLRADTEAPALVTERPRLSADGTIPFNRPPIPGPGPGPEAIRPPNRKDPPSPVRFSPISVLAGVVLAIGIYAVMRDLRFAAISLLSPLIGIGSWYEQRHRRTQDIRAEEARYAQALGSLRTDIAAFARLFRDRLWSDHPDLATVLRRAALPSTRLWQRRPWNPEFLGLHTGVGDVPWRPALDNPAGGRLDQEVKDVLAESMLSSAPVVVDLTDAGVLGIVGDRETAIALARGLVCQAAVHCGPADLTIAVCCDPGREAEWSWATWLPHTQKGGPQGVGTWTSAERGRSETMLRALGDTQQARARSSTLLVIDSDVLLEGTDAPARGLLGVGRTTAPGAAATGHRFAGIVIASRTEQLPDRCTVVLEIDPQATGVAELTITRDGGRVSDVVVAGLDRASARRCALDLARFADPELTAPGSGLPASVPLAPLLGLERISAAGVAKRWAANRGLPPATPVGVGERGPFTIDLVRDGPHGLVGGTTGSGKSEFLRTLVVGLAASHDPSHLTFVLIDFKGGAAFGACDRLPHTVGTVTNLDEHLADRAVRALEAELRYRQEVFATTGQGVETLAEYLAANPGAVMPRLVVVIDEFAMLAKDYPDVLTSLVSIAAVGRTLGVHMILATQRPAGVVSENILANTNLRVALRVQSRDDSASVIGVANAATIARDNPGRAFIKLGENDITPVQTALATGKTHTGDGTLAVQPIEFGVDRPAEVFASSDESAPTDLDALITAIVAAADAAAQPSPRQIWPPPLEHHVALALTDGDGPVGVLDESEPARVRSGLVGSVVVCAVADDPDHQRRVPAGWDLANGNVVLAGVPGSGTTTALASIVLSVSSQLHPDELDLFVLDFGARDLEPLSRLPHTRAYVGSGLGERERTVRLLRHLRDEVDRRKSTPGPHGRTVVVVDGLPALKEEFDDHDGLQLLEGLYRAYADGPEVGMWFAVTTSRPKAVPGSIQDVTTQRWAFRLADPYDYAAMGIPSRRGPANVPGRCIIAGSQLQAQVATLRAGIGAGVDLVARRWGSVAPKPPLIRALPAQLSVAELPPAWVTAEPWRIPIGLREADLEPGYLDLWNGEDALIAGPPRSGKSTALLTIAAALRRQADPASAPVQVWGVCARRSPLASAELDRCAVGAEQLPALLASARVFRGRVVILVDDAEQVDDADHAIEDLLVTRPTDLHIVAAGRADDLRSLYNHWTKRLRRSRTGVLLQPQVDFDGDLLGVSIPRKAPVPMTPGRGYLCVAGTADLIHLAQPTPADLES